MVSSIFHERSQRGIVVSRLDGTRLWLARASELLPVRSTSLSHVFKKGDLVQLDSGIDGASARKCLGTPSDLRHGFVVGTGSIRGGIQRNIEVAVIGTADENESGEGEVEHVISLYSALDLVPLPRVRTTSMTQAERKTLVDTLERVSLDTKIPINAALLVDKFGVYVWGRLWALFASHNAYTTALKAFYSWHTARMSTMSASSLLPDTAKQLLTLREQYRYNHSMPPAQFSAATAQGEGVWSCPDCHTGNSADRRSCIVCAASMPTWKCEKCVQVNFFAQVSCQHCHNSRPGTGALEAVAYTDGGDVNGAPGALIMVLIMTSMMVLTLFLAWLAHAFLSSHSRFKRAQMRSIDGL